MTTMTMNRNTTLNYKRDDASDNQCSRHTKYLIVWFYIEIANANQQTSTLIHIKDCEQKCDQSNDQLEWI